MRPIDKPWSEHEICPAERPVALGLMSAECTVNPREEGVAVTLASTLQEVNITPAARPCTVLGLLLRGSPASSSEEYPTSRAGLIPLPPHRPLTTPLGRTSSLVSSLERQPLPDAAGSTSDFLAGVTFGSWASRGGVHPEISPLYFTLPCAARARCSKVCAGVWWPLPNSHVRNSYRPPFGVTMQGRTESCALVRCSAAQRFHHWTNAELGAEVDA